MKAEAVGSLQPAGIDAATGKDRLVLLGEVFPHHSDHAHIGEVAGSKRKVRGRAAKAVLHSSTGSFNAVECDRSYDQNGHQASFSNMCVYFCGELQIFLQQRP